MRSPRAGAALAEERERRRRADEDAARARALLQQLQQQQLLGTSSSSSSLASGVHVDNAPPAPSPTPATPPHAPPSSAETAATGAVPPARMVEVEAAATTEEEEEGRETEPVEFAVRRLAPRSLFPGLLDGCTLLACLALALGGALRALRGWAAATLPATLRATAADLRGWGRSLRRHTRLLAGDARLLCRSAAAPWLAALRAPPGPLRATVELWRDLCRSLRQQARVLAGDARLLAGWAAASLRPPWRARAATFAASPWRSLARRALARGRWWRARGRLVRAGAAALCVLCVLCALAGVVVLPALRLSGQPSTAAPAGRPGPGLSAPKVGQDVRRRA